MNCSDYQKKHFLLITPDSEHTLPRDVLVHLRTCPVCTSEYQLQNRLIEMLQSMEMPPVSDTDWRKMHSSLLESLPSTGPYTTILPE